MKTRTFFLTILAILVAGICQLDAQTKSVVEKRIGSTIYKLDSVSYRIKNKANKITDREVGSGFIATLDNSKQAYKVWTEQFKPLFSKERVEKLNVRIILVSICDSTGLVKEVEVHFRNRETFEMFTLSEIKAIEDAAKKFRFNIVWHGGEEGQKYVRFVHPLNPYLLYFEKSK